MPRVGRASPASASVPYTAATPGRWARARVQSQSAGRSWCIARPRQRGAVLPWPPPPPQSVTAGQNSPGVAQHAQHGHWYSPLGGRLLSRPIRVPGLLAAQYLLWAEGLRRRDGQPSMSTASYRRIALGSKNHIPPDLEPIPRSCGASSKLLLLLPTVGPDCQCQEQHHVHREPGEARGHGFRWRADCTPGELAIVVRGEIRCHLLSERREL